MQATFEDALLEEALAKKHSLTREAIEVGPICALHGPPHDGSSEKG